MQLFVLTKHCSSRLHCATCRNLNKGRTWRESLSKIFELPDSNIDFECPYGVKWNNEVNTTQSKKVAKNTAKTASTRGGCGCSRNKG